MSKPREKQQTSQPKRKATHEDERDQPKRPLKRIPSFDEEFGTSPLLLEPIWRKDEKREV